MRLIKQALSAALVAALALIWGLTPNTTYGQTPQTQTTEQHSQAGETAAIWLFFSLGMGALCFGVGGVAAARRSK